MEDDEPITLTRGQFKALLAYIESIAIDASSAVTSVGGKVCFPTEDEMAVVSEIMRENGVWE